MGRAWALTMAVLAAGCGGERPQGVEVTEAEETPIPIARAPSALASDTAATDTAAVAALRADSLVSARADSARADSLRRDSLEQVAAAVPDFRTFWPDFRRAVAEGRDAVAARTAFSDLLPRADFEAVLYDAAFAPGPFRDRLLALTARDFAREGTRREGTAVVGFDAGGAIVPEDEADTESAVLLTFDVVDGTYRLVRIVLAG